MTAFLPEKYRTSLEALLTVLQIETGHLYQMHISKYGDLTGGLTINAFKDNPRALAIYDMDPEFTELNGSYVSLGDVRQRIAELDSNDKWTDIKTIKINDEDKQIGKCSHCKSYNEGVLESFRPEVGTDLGFPRMERPAPPRIPHKSPNYINMDICQNCSKWFKSKWDSIDISDSGPEVMKYTGRAGEYRMYDPVGKYKWA